MDEVMALMEPTVAAWFYQRFDSLTEPQSKAIPVIHERRNVLVSSPTGSGKTLTAFTSIINELVRYASEGRLEERIYCIYISPLKALANDINRNLEGPLEEMRAIAGERGLPVPDIRVAVRSGDTSQSDRQKMVRRPPHILITTPESLSLILAAPRFKESFKDVEWVILDEIHDICESKRGTLLSLSLERLRHFCNADFTRIGLSATLAPMDAIAGYLVGCRPDGGCRDVVLIESDTKKTLDLEVICPTEDMTTLSSDIVNSMMYDRLKDLVDTHETTLVFTNTRSGAESVVYKLKERGMESIEVHHSSLGREIRLDVEERLKAGEIKCVVSSTSLELGIDIGSVDLVCQIGSPKSVAKGLQRIGRSGHSFGRVAKGRLLVFDPDDLVECAVMCRAAHRSDIDRVSIPENCLDVLAQAVVGMSLDSRWDVDEAYEVVKGSYSYRTLPRQGFVDVLRYLGSKDEHEGVYSKIWYDEEENRFGRKRGARMIYLMNLGTIPEEANYRVVTNRGTVAGELSEKFVERLAPKDIFVLGGRSFEFVRSKGMMAYVKEAAGRKPTVPSWAGEMLPRSFDLSLDIARFRREMAGRIDEETEGLIASMTAEFDIDEGSARSIVSYMREQRAVTGFIPDIDNLAVEEYIDPSDNQRIIFHFPFGRRVNDALSRAYAYRISSILGANVSVTVTDDNFMIGTSRRIDIGRIPGLLAAADLPAILRKSIKNSEIFKLRFRHTAARSFMILRNYRGRPISVNRQQVRSSYLLEMLGEMENQPVIEETYREVLEDDMDIRNAVHVLETVAAGTAVRTIPFSGTSSPFAHSIILSGFSDIVLMEDRSALLRELHRKVLVKALGDSVRDFEFDEDDVIPYFRQKIGRVAGKSDIVPLLMRTGPLQAMRERGRHIYAYCDVERRTVDGWISELFDEGLLGSVFLDDPHIMAASELPVYAAATARQRDLTEQDSRLLGLIDGRMTVKAAAAELEASEDAVFRSLRKLESMYLVTRTAVTANGRWRFGPARFPTADRPAAVDAAVLRFLECYAPATVHEVAYALALSEEDARIALESLTASEEVAKGFFLVSENLQYMRTLDRLRLRAGRDNVYDFETVEDYKASKGASFDSIEGFFRFYGSAGSELDVFNRVRDFDLREWQALRASGRILLGRFVRGRVRFVLAEDGDRLAALREDVSTAADRSLLEVIDRLGHATLRQLVAETGSDREVVRESLQRLDRSLLVIRAFDEREDWGTENVYTVYRPEPADGSPSRELVRDAVISHGPVSPQALRFMTGLDSDTVSRLAAEAGAESILVGASQQTMYIMPGEVPLLDAPREPDTAVRLLTMSDHALGSKWAELNARYGDRWMYPLVRGSDVIGALEIWEMSGCIEVRSMDLDDPADLPGTLGAIDTAMRFYRMKGTDIVRIREIMGTDAAELDPGTLAVLEEAGYAFVNGFHAKGRFVTRTMTEDEHLSYVFSRQRIARRERYPTVDACISARGYIRNDQELVARVAERTTMRKQMERGLLVRMTLSPPYVGYTTLDFAPLLRASREEEMDEDVRIIHELILDRQPVSRKEVVESSPLSAARTADILSAMSRRSLLYQDADSYYSVVPRRDIGAKEALKELTRMHFGDLGTFSAEELAQYMGTRMGITREVLAELEDEGLLVKGFLIRDDPTPRWMLAADADKEVVPFTERFVLNTQDNLHVYLRGMMKQRHGLTGCMVFRGTEVIGTFRGKLCATGAKIEGFEGSDAAMRQIRETARQLGVRLDEGDEPEEDWDVSEFYLKTHPGM